MKKIFTLCVCFFVVVLTKGQAVLNEFYPDPGNGYQEFFELYNAGTSSAPENLDNYTLITYYEESGGKSGFYVIDLPNLTVAPKGYFVGASQPVFSIQGQSNITADFSWNNMPPSGSLTKWEKSGASYVQVAVPANLNDLFTTIHGSGAIYHVFIFKNGVIVNGAIGGIGSSTVIPGYIKSMPNLFVDMTGSSPDFTVNFGTMSDKSVEYIPPSVGTNNGYFRDNDGRCGVWLKSDKPGEHTPGATNGSATNITGSLTISASISLYSNDPTKSLLTYEITAGPAGAFPIIVDTYSDLGIIGELDASDVLVDSRIINSAPSGNQFVTLPSSHDTVMIVAKSAAGCYEAVLSANRYSSLLPVHLTSFQGNMNQDGKVTLQWNVADNENADYFEVERSFDGNEFKSAGLVFASETTGNEDYMFYETPEKKDKVFYRLKMSDKEQIVTYSKIISFQNKTITTNKLRIYNNPVNDKLTLSYTSAQSGSAQVRVYDMTGRLQMHHVVNNAEGTNIISVSLPSAFKTGLYVVELKAANTRETAKFIKQ